MKDRVFLFTSWSARKKEKDFCKIHTGAEAQEGCKQTFSVRSRQNINLFLLSDCADTSFISQGYQYIQRGQILLSVQSRWICEAPHAEMGETQQKRKSGGPSGVFRKNWFLENSDRWVFHHLSPHSDHFNQYAFLAFREAIKDSFDHMDVLHNVIVDANTLSATMDDTTTLHSVHFHRYHNTTESTAPSDDQELTFRDDDVSITRTVAPSTSKRSLPAHLEASRTSFKAGKTSTRIVPRPTKGHPGPAKSGVHLTSTRVHTIHNKKSSVRPSKAQTQHVYHKSTKKTAKTSVKKTVKPTTTTAKPTTTTAKPTTTTEEAKTDPTDDTAVTDAPETAEAFNDLLAEAATFFHWYKQRCGFFVVFIQYFSNITPSLRENPVLSAFEMLSFRDDVLYECSEWFCIVAETADAELSCIHYMKRWLTVWDGANKNGQNHTNLWFALLPFGVKGLDRSKLSIPTKNTFKWCLKLLILVKPHKTKLCPNI